jgi:hypothetical protein
MRDSPSSSVHIPSRTTVSYANVTTLNPHNAKQVDTALPSISLLILSKLNPRPISLINMPRKIRRFLEVVVRKVSFCRRFCTSGPGVDPNQGPNYKRHNHENDENEVESIFPTVLGVELMLVGRECCDGDEMLDSGSAWGWLVIVD